MKKRILKINIIIFFVIILILVSVAIKALASSLSASDCPYNIKFTQVAYELQQTVLAIDADGYLWTWGRDETSYMQSGSISTVPLKISTTNRFKQISGTYALDTNGNIWEIEKTTLTQKTTGTVFKKISSSSSGGFCLAIDNANNLYSYGNNEYGQLANGKTTDVNGGRSANHTSFIKVRSGIKDISAGTNHALAIDTSNNLYAWGKCEAGAIGNGKQTGNDTHNVYTTDGTSITTSIPTQSTPVQIKSNISKISAEGDMSFAIDTSGNLWSWGSNYKGSLGNGGVGNSTYASHECQTTPLKIASNISQVAVGQYGGLAIDTTGNLWGWGYNYHGELGNGTNTQQNTPIKINTKNTISQIAMTNSNSMYIDSEGDLWTAGSNYYGELGNGRKENNAYWTKEFIQITATPTYTITLNTNGGTINSGEVQSYKLGEGATLPTDVTKTGYTFGGWYENSSFSGNRVTSIGSTETGNKTYYAKWTVSTYTVTLNANGGTINSGNVTSYTYGSTKTLPTNVTKTGYTFGGWYENSSFSGNRVTSIGSTETGNKTYYAKWTANTYTVTLNANGGTINSGNITSYTYGSTKTLPTNVTKTGYTFGGWYENSSFSGNRVTSIGSTETGNKTYYAKWTANTYTVTLNANGGTINSGNITSYTYGSTKTLPTNVTKTGYTFGGWYENSSFSGNRVTSISSTETGNKTYYAKWTANTTTAYKVEHYKQTNSGYTLAEREDKTGQTYAQVTATPKTYAGYTQNTTIADRIPSGNIAADGSLVLKLYYDRNTNTAYKVEHYKQTDIGYTLAETEQKTGTTDTQVTATPKTYAGYTQNTTITDRIPTGSIVGDGSLVLKLYYDRNTNTAYKVEHYKQTDTGYTLVETEEKTGPTDAIATATPKTYVGYTQNTTIADRIPSGNIVGDGSLVLKLYYDRNTNTAYKIEHYIRNLDNEVVGYELFETEEKTGTTDTQVIATPKTYSGYTQNTTIADRIPNGNIAGNGSLVLKLYYDRNVYKINYELNGGTSKNPLNKSYTYGEEIILTTKVEKEGYRFAGWYENEECTGQAITSIKSTDIGDKTYYAKWEKEQEIPFTITSEKYEISNETKYISRVSPETTVETFTKNITTNGNMKVLNQKGEEIQNTQLVGTGYKLQVEYKGTKYEYEIAVRGDLDGNGKITATDLSTLNQTLIKKIHLTGIKEKAADVDYNGEITVTDLSVLNQALIKKIML